MFIACRSFPNFILGIYAFSTLISLPAYIHMMIFKQKIYFGEKFYNKNLCQTFKLSFNVRKTKKHSYEINLNLIYEIYVRGFVCSEFIS